MGAFPFNSEQYAAILRIRHGHFNNGNMEAVIAIDTVTAGAYFIADDPTVVYHAAELLLRERSMVDMRDCEVLENLTGFAGEEVLRYYMERMKVSLSFA